MQDRTICCTKHYCNRHVSKRRLSFLHKQKYCDMYTVNQIILHTAVIYKTISDGKSLVQGFKDQLISTLSEWRKQRQNKFCFLTFRLKRHLYLPLHSIGCTLLRLHLQRNLLATDKLNHPSLSEEIQTKK